MDYYAYLSFEPAAVVVASSGYFPTTSIPFRTINAGVWFGVEFP